MTFLRTLTCCIKWIKYEILKVDKNLTFLIEMIKLSYGYHSQNVTFCELTSELKRDTFRRTF